MLDNRTGDMFRWLEPGAAIGGGWAPVGNVGLHAAFGKVSLGKVNLGRVNPSPSPSPNPT